MFAETSELADHGRSWQESRYFEAVQLINAALEAGKCWKAILMRNQSRQMTSCDPMNAVAITYPVTCTLPGERWFSFCFVLPLNRPLSHICLRPKIALGNCSPSRSVLFRSDICYGLLWSEVGVSHIYGWPSLGSTHDELVWISPVGWITMSHHTPYGPYM